MERTVKYIYIIVLLSLSLISPESEKNESKYVAHVIPDDMSVATKKERFYELIAPVVLDVHAQLQRQHDRISSDIKNSINIQKIQNLKKIYKVKTDEELLLALKPHQPSIVLAQAAMESSWATSRFFVEANNVFGMWSYNPKEPRIAANEQRNSKKIIWLKKFDSIEESVIEYYKLMGRGYAFKEFRKTRYKSNDIYKIVKKLNRYSELDQKYTKELASMIKYNKLTKYD